MPIFSLLIGLRVPPARAHRRRRGSPASASASSASPSSRVARRGRRAGPSIGTLAVVLASVFYASAGIYSQLHLRGTISGPVLATGSMLAGGLILLPLAIAQPPRSLPTAGAIGSLLAAGAPRHGARAAAPVPRRPAVRGAPAQPRHLPAAGIRARLRRPHPRRARQRLGADRPGADPARRRARLRVAAAAATASGRGSGTGDDR